MRTLITTLLVAIFITTSAQDSDLEFFRYANKWRSGKLKEVYEYNKVTKVESHGYGFTNAAYQDTVYLINEVAIKADREMWTLSKTVNEIESIRKFSPGGRVIVHIGRLTIGSANTQYFTVVIKDLEGHELYRKELNEDIPQVPGRDGLWWNTALISLPEGISYPFNIYVIDGLDDEHPIHHFLVEI